jgi:hypothetical protein
VYQAVVVNCHRSAIWFVIESLNDKLCLRTTFLAVLLTLQLRQPDAQIIRQ